ncbi:SPOR domain-containing protein [Telluribacter sp.]|jgi:hypothetical protein|uniref:SPOR domain-containing protein n=1 Tax=Telluribacter sp. TaxID=1978767 RepID=UPI002E146B3D|nr:SPOR domain-containing protein [Telluribacter sp.]
MIRARVITLLILGVGVAGMSACSRKGAAAGSGTEYREDLSRVRPRYSYVEPTLQKSKAPERKEQPVRRPSAKDDTPLYINKRLEAALDTMYNQNKAIRYINGYRIQMYVGNVRGEADAAKAYIYQMFPDLNPYVSYSQPTYRVKVGDFMYRSDAEQYLEQIRQKYPSSIILSDRVEIKRGLQIGASAEATKE